MALNANGQTMMVMTAPQTNSSNIGQNKIPAPNKAPLHLHETNRCKMGTTHKQTSQK